ncbi:hypothetical protein BFL28_17465 [Sphingomonas turrisvirgatae]|uniref:Uncharacterized protein n=2 Tax=Sphingomonas turrisvirgatae TaxID=1888892 RepID=A0A1E3LUQ8_9SPHN|nr:hypothetical protein BFL28_17465 [Sphingomonas turrisvirgatae]
MGASGQSDWRVIYVEGEKPRRSVQLMDFRWIEASDGKRRAWRSQVQEAPGDISYDLILEEYDCKRRTAETKKYVYPKGANENTVVEGNKKAQDVIPGTKGEIFLLRACGEPRDEMKIPAAIDPILYIQRYFKSVSKQQLSAILSKFLAKIERPLKPAQSVAVYRAFDGIAKARNLPNLIDSRLELMELFESVDKYVKDEVVADQIKSEFRNSFDVAYFIRMKD